MDPNQLCPNCGQPVVLGAPQELCPECLLKSGFETAAANEAGGRKSAFVPPTVEAVAKLFPQLEILELLGHGGMGAVYKVRQPRLNRFVALKILSPEKQNNPQFAERFEREARALAWLSHPNVVTIYDFGEVSGIFYLLMGFVDGLSLRQLLQQRRLAPGEALAIVVQICQALQYAHEQGVIHRDIKPENILLDKKGQVKIADFGIAKLMGGEPPDISLTGAADVVGTPHYMAPEQIEKPQTVDQRADIYSLGVVFYEMLTGELPLGNFPPPSQKVQIDVRLDEVVLHALAKEPERRYQEAGEVKTAVETIASTTAPAAADGQLARDYLAKDYTLDITRCLRRGWALLAHDFWSVLGVTILVQLLQCAAAAMFVGLVVSGPLLGGLCLFFLKKIRGEPASVGTVFSGFSPAFWPLCVASLLMGMFTFFGFICLLLPGIYLLVAWSFTLALIIDKQLGFWPAMGLSRKIISRHWWKFFGFIIVLSLMNLAGLIAFFVGSLLTVPVALAALMFAYEDIFGAQRPAAVPATPPARPSMGVWAWPLAGLLVAGVIVGLMLPHRRHARPAAADTVVSAVPATLVTNHVASDDFQNLLNADQRLVSQYINTKYQRFADDRTFDGWSRYDRNSLEQRLLDVIRGPRSDEYYQAISTLAALRSTNALPLLRRMAFEHKNTINRTEVSNRSRWLAVRAMGVIGDQADVPDIIHLLYHNNAYVRWSAQIALVRLTGQNFGTDWRAWGQWWNAQNGNPPFNPTAVRWWRDQPDPDEFAKELAQADRKFLGNVQGIKSGDTSSDKLVNTLSE